MKAVFVIALAAILSLSMFAHVFAEEGNSDQNAKSSDDDGVSKAIVKDSGAGRPPTEEHGGICGKHSMCIDPLITHKPKDKGGDDKIGHTPDPTKCGDKGVTCKIPIDTKPGSPPCKSPKILLSNGECVDSHTDRPDNDCRFNPGLGKCSADCTQDKSFCECPAGFLMNEDDHCTPDKPCPKGFEQHADDETSTCFPTAKTLRGHPDARPINIRINNHVSASATATATATTAPLIISPTVPNGLNATFFDPTTPYCWYVVNAPPCFDVISNTILH